MPEVQHADLDKVNPRREVSDLWSHVAPVPCVVLDPFLGSGTTAYVARNHGRKSIGIELNPAYADLAAKRMSQQSLLV